MTNRRMLLHVSWIAILLIAGTWLLFLHHQRQQNEPTFAERLAQPAVMPSQTGSGESNPSEPSSSQPGEPSEAEAEPSDINKLARGWFAGTLRPVEVEEGRSTDKDNAALIGLLERFTEHDSETARIAAVEQWLQAHPNSRWHLSLKAQLMELKYSRGYFAEARAGWDEIWEVVKDSEELNAFHLGNDVLARLLDANTGLARSDRLRELVTDAEDRILNAPLEGKLFRAREAVWLIDHTVAQNVRCGLIALNAIKQHQEEDFLTPRMADLPKGYQETGVPLSELVNLASRDYDLDLRMAKRSSSAEEIPVPSVVHWKDEHFSALVEVDAEADRYYLVDRTNHFDGWVDREALDQLSSGYFLVRNDTLPTGWQEVNREEGQTVFGRDGQHGVLPTEEAVTEDAPIVDEEAPNSCGMPGYTFHPIPGAIRIGDIPLRYFPPVGPAVALKLNYNDMDGAAPTSPPNFANVGLGWSTDWVAWVDHRSGSYNNSTVLTVHVPGGGAERLNYSTATGQFGPHDLSFATVRRTGSYTYTRTLPDGSKLVFNAPDHPTSPSRVFLSELIDPQGNSLSFAYDGNMRLISVTDEIGQMTQLSYNDPFNIYRITRVQDPFGRRADLSYDVAGRLIGITDMLGLTSTFTYHSSNGFVATMTTPYGTSQFRKVSESLSGSSNGRIVEATDPQGDIELIEFNDLGNSFVPGIQPAPDSVRVGNEVIPVYAEDTRLQFRNAWYWDKQASHYGAGDYKAARNYRFYTGSGGEVLPVVEAIKNPLEDRVWFNYPGGESNDSLGYPNYPGERAVPEKILRMLPDGTPQLVQTYTNDYGRITKTVDPLGRTTESIYAANGIDLIEVRQTSNGIDDRLVSLTYNSLHQPLTVTDAAGQTTTFTYNARGQVLTIRNPLNETTTFTYNANGYLTTVNGPLPGSADSSTYTYDSVGRIRTTTNPDGYTRTLSYDNFDRITRIDYPDGTFETVTYDRLDRASVRDRLGRVTSFDYNALRQLIGVTDPQGRTTLMEWCRCGDLRNLTDALGRITHWRRDIQGRVIAKEFPDGSKTEFEYDIAGRLVAQLDEKGQKKAFTYFADGALRSISYANARQQTAPVSYNYDPDYPRVVSTTDGIGQTTFLYRPAGSLGAGQIASEDGPFPDDNIIYTYDALYRTTTTDIAGTAASRVFDAGGRVTSLTDVLGTTTLGYDGVTSRPTSVNRPNGVTTSFTYFGNQNDRRLREIHHRRSNSSTISRFEYNYDAAGRILNWIQQTDNGTPENWTIGYDSVDQLTGVQIAGGNDDGDDYSYAYDAAGNRLSATENGSATNFSYNNLNQLVSSTGNQPERELEWDAEDRLVALVVGSSRFEFDYDGTGRCRRIRTYENGSLADEKSYVWEGLSRREERTADGSGVLRHFRDGGIRVEGTSPTSHFYTFDHLGSIREVLSGTQTVESRLDYGPWGTTTLVSGDGSLAPFGFTGHFRHAPTGLYLAPFRVYDPLQARWLSRDPIASASGTNPYSYVWSNPISLADLNGLWPTWDEIGDRFINGFAGAAGGAVTGTASGAAVGAGIGAFAGGVGAVPGAIAGASSGAIGGAISGFITGFIGSSCQSAGDAAIDGAISGVAGGAISGAGAVLTKAIQSSALLKAGQALDRNGLTKAGRALQKHGDRAGSVFPKATGDAASRNAQGQKILEEIISSPQKVAKPNRFGGQDIFDLTTGRGVRFDGSGAMKGFLEP